MNIITIDNSISSPGFVKARLNNSFEVEDIQMLTFTSSKRFAASGAVNVIYYNNKDFNHQYNKIVFMNEEFEKWADFDNIKYDYGFIEDYAFAAVGQVFSIAESTGLIKRLLFNNSIPFRLYSVPSIKKFFSGKGNADKIKMEIAYNNNKSLYKPDLRFLPSVVDKKSGNPIDNIIDAFAIFELGLFELKIRNNLINIETEEQYIQEVFAPPKKKKNRKKQEPGYAERDFVFGGKS